MHKQDPLQQKREEAAQAAAELELDLSRSTCLEVAAQLAKRMDRDAIMVLRLGEA